MFCAEDTVQLQYPVLETGLTASEIQELWKSLIESPTSSQNSGSIVSNRMVYTDDERKRKRMKSNRESARRSRWRKKRHLENLTVQVNRLEIQNQELKKRLGSVFNHCNVLCRENNRLTTEYLALQARLSDLCHALVAMHAMQRPNNYHHRQI